MVKNNLMWFLIFPFMLNLMIFFGGVLWIGFVSETASNLINDTVNDWFGLESNGWISGTIRVLVEVTFRIAWFIIYSVIIGTVLLVVLSPVFALLSERVERIARGKGYPFSLGQLFKDVVRGALIAIRNFFLQNLSVLVILVCISWIPVIGQVAAIVLTTAVVAYFYGFSFLDYTNERWKFRTKKSVGIIRKYRGAAVGLGFTYQMAFLIPSLVGFVATIFLGFLGGLVFEWLTNFVAGFLASTVAMFCVVGGTLFLLDQEEFKAKPESEPEPELVPAQEI